MLVKTNIENLFSEGEVNIGECLPIYPKAKDILTNTFKS